MPSPLPPLPADCEPTLADAERLLRGGDPEGTALALHLLGSGVLRHGSDGQRARQRAIEAALGLEPAERPSATLLAFRPRGS
jgi:hypothetical protein